MKEFELIWKTQIKCDTWFTALHFLYSHHSKTPSLKKEIYFGSANFVETCAFFLSSAFFVRRHYQQEHSGEYLIFLHDTVLFLFSILFVICHRKVVRHYLELYLSTN